MERARPAGRRAAAGRGSAGVSPGLAVLCGGIVSSLVMVLLWRRALRTRNAGVVDVAWSFLTGILAAGFALAADGLPERRILIAVLALAWSARLGVHLWQRVTSEEEDVRYRRMREEQGDRFPRFLLGFHLLQAAWTVLFALPMLAAARNREPFGAADLAAVALWGIAVGGEAAADRQLLRFRRDPANRGKVCRYGLWSLTRHPNYFFEWLQWWVWVLLGLGAPQGWLTLGGPLVMYLFLTRVTGIPPTEARLVESRGEEYRRYQREVNAFFPGPAREAS